MINRVHSCHGPRKDSDTDFVLEAARSMLHQNVANSVYRNRLNFFGDPSGPKIRISPSYFSILELELLGQEDSSDDNIADAESSSLLPLQMTAPESPNLDSSNETLEELEEQLVGTTLDDN